MNKTNKTNKMIIGAIVGFLVLVVGFGAFKYNIAVNKCAMDSELTLSRMYFGDEVVREVCKEEINGIIFGN